MNEPLRIHPPTGFVLEHLVPKGGVTLCDTYIEENTVVDMNPWVMHRNAAIFGNDVETFCPERWIDKDPEQMKEMHRNLVAVSIAPEPSTFY